jgi:hypothetical protein
MRYFIPITDLTAAELADAFVARIYALHGAPDTIISDRGTQFISEFWKKLSARFSITLKHSSAYYPEINGQTEKINTILKQYLKTYMNFRQNNWVDWLPLAEFALNNAVSETISFSPFFANYGFNSKLGFEPRPPYSPDKILQQKREFIKAYNIADRFDRILTQMKAFAEDTNRRYENQANQSRTDALRYKIGD